MRLFKAIAVLVMLVTTTASPYQGRTGEGWMPPACETYDRLYWETRPIITAVMRCDTSGRITTVELLGDTLSESCSDSLLALTKQWVKREGIRLAGRRGRCKEFAYFSLDGRDSTSSEVEARRLPGFALAALERSPYDEWVAAWASRTPGFGLSQFVTCGVKTMHRIGGQGLLSTPRLIRKAALGLLCNSPDGEYVLDPFEGMEITDKGEAGWDIDTGYATYDARTGDRLHYYVDTMSGVDLAYWVDGNKFMLFGMATLDHSGPRWLERTLLRVPAIWIGDMAEQKIALYLGLPALSIYNSAVLEETNRLRARAFPDIAW